jgi:hypothetical protein
MPWRTDLHGMWLFGENCTLEYLHGGWWTMVVFIIIQLIVV